MYFNKLSRALEKIHFDNFGDCECNSPIANSAVFFDIIPLVRAIFADPVAREYLKYHLSKDEQDVVSDITESLRFIQKKNLFGNRLTDFHCGLNQDG